MVSASDGSAFTGSVTCYVTGDGGTQAAGSVGSGACTHEGNGFHTYAPAQAETNYDHVAFTFTGTGAIPVTVQIYPSFPQTGDSYARLGAPAGASVSADIAALPTAAENRAEMDSNSTQLAAIVADTNELQTDDVPGLIAALNDPTAAAIADAVLDEALSGHVTAGTLGKAVADIETDATAILADTAEIGTAGAGLTAVPWNAAWDAEVQSECTDALNAYDPPTNAEMEARTIVAANYATASAVATVDTNVDDLKSGIIYGAAATGTLSTTQASTNLTGYADDQLIGRHITWLSGNCEGEQTDITDYANTNGVLTFTALTTAPANGDTFKIT